MKKDDVFQLGEKIVNEVANEIVRLSKKQPLGKEVGSIGAGGDLTKVADDISEKITAKIISSFIKKKSGIKIVLISEENGITEFGKNDGSDGVFMIMDPLDGSNNLRDWKTPCPFVTISLAIGDLKNLEKKDDFDSIDIGFVRDIFNNRLYFAKTGQGSFVDNFGEIESSPEIDIKKSIIGVDFDLQSIEYDRMYSNLHELMKIKKCQRRLGSSIFDFLKVASGEYDANISLGSRMKLHDIAAVQLIIKESGGLFEVINDKADYFLIKKLIETKRESLIGSVRYKIIASGNEVIHKQIKKYIR